MESSHTTICFRRRRIVGCCRDTSRLRYNKSSCPPKKVHTPLQVPFDSLTLAAVVAELRPLLIGGRIQDIRQPEPNELLLAIRSRAQSLSLLLSSDARFARVHLTTARKPNSPSPSAFLIALRRHVESGRNPGCAPARLRPHLRTRSPDPCRRRDAHHQYPDRGTDGQTQQPDPG